MAKDTCVICGVETPYDFETHIDLRHGYLEGVGQLCRSCYKEGTDREFVSIPKHIILDNPNNMLLGEAVRRYYNENY